MEDFSKLIHGCAEKLIICMQVRLDERHACLFFYFLFCFILSPLLSLLGGDFLLFKGLIAKEEKLSV